MSSRDFGPALPPHMKQSHRDSDAYNEEQTLKSHSSSDRRRNEGRRERSGNKYRDFLGDRHRDEGKERRREGSARCEGKDRERLSGREYDRRRHKRREESPPSKDQRKGSGTKIPKEYSKETNRRLKRSKSDRTYNTDTEDSSDDHGEMEEWSCHKRASVSSGNTDDDSAERKELSSSVRLESHHNLQQHSVSILSETNCGMLTEQMGPALPPHLLKRAISPALSLSISGEANKTQTSKDESSEKTDTHQLKPQSPVIHQRDQDSGIHPASPSHENKSSRTSRLDSSSVIGPLLPPNFSEMTGTLDQKVALPAYFVSSKEHSCDTGYIGPALPSNHHEKCSAVKPPDDNACSDSCDEETVGPLLPDEMIRSGKNFMVQSLLERNAAAIKLKMEGNGTENTARSTREEWMLELPPENTLDLGLGPRSFRVRGAPEKGADRSAWTDTPADKCRKEEEAKQRFECTVPSSSDLRSEAACSELSRRDKVMENIVKKHSKKRSKESMLEAHQKKLQKEKKKKEESGEKHVRRPFNREIDLKTNAFDDAQKKSIFKKAQLLDNRFSSGEHIRKQGKDNALLWDLKLSQLTLLSKDM